MKRIDTITVKKATISAEKVTNSQSKVIIARKK